MVIMLAGFPVKHRRAAFTLVELMVVMVVISIISAVVIGEMSGGLQDALLRSSSRRLIGVFNLASSRAISVNRLYRVRFNRTAGGYVVEKHVRGDEYALARDVPEAAGSIDSRIALRVREAEEMETEDEQPEPSQPESADQNAINFYPDGTTDDRLIELRDRDGFGLALRLSAVTARVQVIELERQ